MSTLFLILATTLSLAIPQHAIPDGIAMPQEQIVVGQGAAYPLNVFESPIMESSHPGVFYEDGSVPMMATEEYSAGHIEYGAATPVVSYRPAGGIVVSIDAEQVFKQALAQSWNCVNEGLGRRHVNGKMFSKVDYQIKPVASFDGALLQIYMDGVSYGQTTAIRSEKNKVVIDALTHFKSRQMLLLRSTGAEYGPLDLTVDASQDFNRTTSSNPLASTLAKRVLNKPNARFKAQTNSFAKKQIERNVAKHLAMTYEKGVQSLNQLHNRIPMLHQFSWSVSSDDKFIYAAADSYEMPMQTMSGEHFGSEVFSQSPYPVTITMNDEVATNLLNEQMANKQLGSLGLESQYDAMSKFLHLPKLEVKNDQYWTIDFGQFPGRINFVEDRINFELQADKIASDKQSNSNMIVGFSLRPLYKNGYWYLARDEKVTVRHADDDGGRLGARQLAFRTVMSKRLERVIPEYVALKRPASKTNHHDALDLELSLDKIQPSFGQLTFGLKSK